MKTTRPTDRPLGLITFTSIAQRKAPVARKPLLTRAERTLLILAVATVASWLGYAAVASAAEPPKVQRCSFIYINGDAVISCPRVAK